MHTLGFQEIFYLTQIMKKFFYFSIGCISFILGTAGIILPLLPTTCFWLLAAWAFSKSSSRFYNRLVKHPAFGPVYYNWQRNRTIPPRFKQVALASLVFSMSLGCYLLSGQFTAQIILISIMLLISSYLLYLPSSSEESVAK